MRVKQLVREHPHLELERELQRLTEDLELEREGRTHNHRERQRLGEELERERRARSGDQRNVQRPRARSSGGAAGSQASEEVLMDIPLKKQQPLGHHRGIAQCYRNPLRDAEGGGALALCTTYT
jgi:hypothetical protein